MNEMHEKKNAEKFLNKTFCPKSQEMKHKDHVKQAHL